MVLVDIYVPSVDKTYNFSLNEQTKIRAIVSEITEMIEQKEQIRLIGDKERLCLYSVRDRAALPTESTLRECMTKSGSRLILI